MHPGDLLSLYLLVALAAFFAMLWIDELELPRLLKTWRRRLRFSLAALFGVLTFACLLVAVMRPRTIAEWVDTVFLAAPLMITTGAIAVAASYLIWDCFAPERWKKRSLVIQRKRRARREPELVAAPGEYGSQGASIDRARRREKWWLRRWRAAYIPDHYSLRQPEPAPHPRAPILSSKNRGSKNR